MRRALASATVLGDVAGGTQQDDTLRWLSSATPYARWVGRRGEEIPLYDPTSNQPTGEVLDTAPKAADLPAPEYRRPSSAASRSAPPTARRGFKSSRASYPGVQPGDEPGSKRSMTDASTPTQDSGGGFSYTIEHEAAHNLGLSHPHDGSCGVDRCPAGTPNAGKWGCYWSGLGWMYDVSAAPTTYAMSYRPYEVEDQDNLQRGHVAEYLLGAQQALTDRLVDEAGEGRTTPSAGWQSDFDRMKQSRTQAGELFRAGDYLHAEYAARNAAIAARGIPQTKANTSDPKLLEAGQVFYFDVYPQAGSGAAGKPDLRPTDLAATQAKPKETTLKATVVNEGDADATGVVVRFRDGSSAAATSAPVDVPAGGQATVSVVWDTRSLKGDHLVTAVVDPDDTVAESDESDNELARTITVRGNKVTNGSFEQSSSGTSPDAWSGGSGTTYDTSGTHSTDGTDAVGLKGGLLGATWTSAPVPVEAGRTYDLAMSFAGVAPSVSIGFLDKAGALLSTVPVTPSLLTGSLGAKVDVPAGASALRIGVAKAPTLQAGQATWVDDVWLW